MDSRAPVIDDDFDARFGWRSRGWEKIIMMMTMMMII